MSDYKRIRALFPDHLGIARGKYIPAKHIGSDLGFCVTTFALTYDRDMRPNMTARLLEGLPDADLHYNVADIRPSWDADIGIVIGDLSFHGKPIPASPRHVLRQAISDWKELGYDVMVGLEQEMFVMQPDGEGGWTEWDTPGSHVYGTGPASDPSGLIQEIMDTADELGFDLEAVNTEFDTPQFELTLHVDEPLKHVDDTFLFRLMVREIGMKRGLRLTFTGKPFSDRGGNGFHVNFSLQKDGKNAFYDPDSEDGLSDLAYACIAGQIDKHKSMSVICAPTVNAYKRLQPGQLSGYWANWGYDHRGVTIRVPHQRGKATRLENRMSDGAANPYLATAAVLQAARLGYLHKTELPAAEDRDCFESQSTEICTPANLHEACAALAADQEFSNALGAECVEGFLTVKEMEWEKYVEAVPNWEQLDPTDVSQWELDFYTPYL